MAISYNERRTDVPISQTIYAHKTYLSSSDMNESMYIINKNIVEYFIGDVGQDTIKIAINNITKTMPATTTTLGFNYVICDNISNMYFGKNNANVVLDIYNPIPSSTYNVYAFVRTVLLDKSSITYKNGIRTNDLQPSIVEEETQNNIEDPDLPDEIVTGRLSLEFTFVIRNEDEDEPILDNWNYHKLISKIYIDENNVPTKIDNIDKDIDTNNIVTKEEMDKKLNGFKIVTMPADNGDVDNPNYIENIDEDGNTYYTIEINVEGVNSDYTGTGRMDYVRPTPYNVNKRNAIEELFLLITDTDSMDGKIKFSLSDKPSESFQIYLYGI